MALPVHRYTDFSLSGAHMFPILTFTYSTPDEKISKMGGEKHIRDKETSYPLPSSCLGSRPLQSPFSAVGMVHDREFSSQ